MYRFNFKSKSILSAAILTLAANTASAQDAHHHHGHHGASAPIGVMGDHVMPEGGSMLSYRYMKMSMGGWLDGTDSVSLPLPGGYMVNPLWMDMDMHMLGGMYGVSDDLTVMVMVPFIDMSMNHEMVMGMMAGNRFTTASSGIGDVKIMATYKLDKDLLLNAGVALPTGSIDERDDTPMMANAKLPYPMQLGSGTTDLMLGVTTTGDGWGVQGIATIRTGENDNGYTLGNVLNINAWMSKGLAEDIDGSVRINARNWDNIDGADADLNPAMVPTADPDLRGGTRIDVAGGMNYKMGDHRLGLEIALPVYQNLDGPQMETDLVITLGYIAGF